MCKAGLVAPKSIGALALAVLLLLLEVGGSCCSEKSLRGGSVPALLLETEELTEDPSQPHVKEYAKLELEAEIRAALNGTKADLDGRDKVVDEVVKYSPRYKYRANIPDEPPDEVTSENFKLPNCSLPGCGESWNQFESGEDAAQQNETSSLPTFDDDFDPEVDYEGGGKVSMGGTEIGTPVRSGRSPFSHFFQWYHCGSCPNGKCPKHCNGHHQRRRPSAGCAGQCKELCGAGSWEDGCLKDCLEDCGQGGSTRGEIFRLEREIAGKTDLCPTNGDCKTGNEKKGDRDDSASSKGADYEEQLGDLSTDEDISRDERKEDDELSTAASHIQDDERSPVGVHVHHKGEKTTFKDIKHIEDQLTAETSDVAEADGTSVSSDDGDDSDIDLHLPKEKHKLKHKTKRAARKSRHGHSNDLKGEERSEHHKKKHRERHGRGAHHDAKAKEKHHRYRHKRSDD